MSQRLKSLIEENKEKGIIGWINWNNIDVVVFGQLASDSLFHQALQEAFSSFTQRPILPPTIQGADVWDAVFAAAFGAGRSAKSFLNTLKPQWCSVEDEKCTKLREEVYRDSLTSQPEEVDVQKGEL